MPSSNSRASVAVDAALASGILVLGGALLMSGGSILGRWQRTMVAGTFPGPGTMMQDLGAADLLGALAAAAGSAIVAWWLLSMACSAAAVAFERRGSNSHGAAAARRLSPAFMRRLILAVLSLQLFAGPAAQASVAPGPEWMPTRTEAAAPAGAGAARPDGLRPAVEPRWKPSAPITGPGLLARHGARAAGRAHDASKEPAAAVTVLAGDTLWDIAKKDLGPDASDVDVALHWPRWYQANHALIGLSPDVLLPGQVLHRPEGI